MLGQKLAGRYELTQILGAGGFGQTYLAIDTHQDESAKSYAGQTSLRAYCVVKQLKPASQDQSFLSIARRLFETEVKTLKRLGSHPQIPALLDSFEEDNEFYLVQEYIDGVSLEDEIARVEQFDEAAAIALLGSVLPVLDFIHDHHVIHRDLKPDNLIRRKETGEIVLIDFGAVKEIRTRIITGEQTALTIGIGTQGYTPSEQLSGKPRYSSDIFALGMTVIQALTGKSPIDLPEDPNRLEPCWEDCAKASPGLIILLNKMTRHYIYQRYDSVKTVQHDLARLEELPLEAAQADTYLETSIPRERLPADRNSSILRWRMGRRAKKITAAVSMVLTSAFVLGLRQVGAFVPAELAVYDSLVAARVDATVDSRLLVVEFTEEDERSLGVSDPSDALVAQAIENIQQYEPASIGLDLLRDIPQEPGNEQLLESLRSPEVVAIAKLSDSDSDVLIPPPPGVALDQTGFSNILPDTDFRVRRAWMADYLETELIYSLGTKLALRYLEQYEDIVSSDGEILMLGETRFKPLSSSFGGYQNVDSSGYQMFMKYRSLKDFSPRISFSDVLNNKIEPALVKDRIVLIGLANGSSRDLFSTPFNRGDLTQTPGVVLHAQVANQILSAVLDGESLPWAWPDWLEIGWIVLLTGVGGGLMVLTQRGPILIAFGISGLLTAVLVSVVCFELGGWVPMVAPASAFFLSAAGARISKSYQRRYWEAQQI